MSNKEGGKLIKVPVTVKYKEKQSKDRKRKIAFKFCLKNSLTKEQAEQFIKDNWDEIMNA